MGREERKRKRARRAIRKKVRGEGWVSLVRPVRE